MSTVSHTIRILLQRVGDQTAVIRTRWQQVWDPIVVIVVITLVSLSIFVSIQLRAVDDSWAVVPRVLVTIAITGQETDVITGANLTWSMKTDPDKYK